MFASSSRFTCLSWINILLKIESFLRGMLNFFYNGGAYAGKKERKEMLY